MCAPTSLPPSILAVMWQSAIAWVAVLVAVVLVVLRIVRNYRSLPLQKKSTAIVILDSLTYGAGIASVVILFLIYIPWGDALQAWYSTQLEQLIVANGCTTALLDAAYAPAKAFEQAFFFVGIGALVILISLSAARSDLRRSA
jgi:hypothetical protein